MAGLRLRDRQLGAEFCRFERSMIFDPDKRDVGYVSFIDGRTFRLVKSKFTPMDSGKVYSLPPDLSRSVEQGSLVRVVPGKVRREIIVQETGADPLGSARFVEMVEVESVEEARLPLPPPALPVDEFLSRTSLNWRGAEEDLLDKVIALLLVSAPSSIYGRGGLGAEGLEGLRAPASGTPRDVSQTIMAQLPVEFRTAGTPHYRYISVDSLKGVMDLGKARSAESCFSIVRPHSVKDQFKAPGVVIQLPFVLRNASLRKVKMGIDLDVLDYQLTALYTPPPSERFVEERATSLLRDSHREAFWDQVGMGEPDPMAGLRLGLALTRLYVGKQFSGSGYTRKRTDIEEGLSFFKALLDRGYDEVRKRMKEEDLYAREREHPWRSRLKPLDKRIYMQLRALSESGGAEVIEIGQVLPGEDRRTVEESLERLNRYGYLLFLKGGKVVKVVRSADPESQG